MADRTFDLDKVARTLLLPLWGRAEWTRTGNRILSDPGAVALVERIAASGYDFSRLASDLNFSNNICWIARARQFDDKVRAFLARCPDGRVVNLGAGLDTSFARVDNGCVRWVDLDQEEVIHLRRGLIPESDRARCVVASLLDPSWPTTLGGEGGNTLFLAGGVLFYFHEDEVKAVFEQMGAAFPGAEFVFDAFTPEGLEKANRLLEKVGMNDAPMHWAIRDVVTLETWPGGARVVEQFEYFRGLDLGGLPWKVRLMTLANRLLKVMNIVHVRVGGSSCGASGEP